VFEKRVLTRIFGPKRDEAKGQWRKLHNEELQNLYSFQNIIEVGGACGTHGREKKVYKVLVRKPEGKRPLGRPRRRQEDGIRMDLGETDWGVWTGFSWLRTGTGGGIL
jgi:hypothetical protein